MGKLVNTVKVKAGGVMPKRGQNTIPPAGGKGGAAHAVTPKSPGTDIGGAKSGSAHGTMTAKTGSHGYSESQAIGGATTLIGK